MKKVIKSIVLVFICVILFVSCSQKDKSELKGKYISMYDESIWYSFDGKGNFSTNDIRFSFDNSPKGFTGKYEIDEDFHITLYYDECSELDFGYIYKDYVCRKMDGVLPKNNHDSALVTEHSMKDMLHVYQFNNDGTISYGLYNDKNEPYESSITLGTYKVKNNKIICNTEGYQEEIFFDTKDGVYYVNFKMK